MQTMRFIKIMLMSLLVNAPTFAMTPLTDDELQAEVGQALFNLSYVAPNQSGNPNTNIGFYRVGLQADLELNANIAKLKLGCGGANGADPNICDVDIDRLRFSGFANATNIYNDAAPVTDFLLKNPYIEFAIRNPNSASTREIVGLRLGALQAAGMMSFGERPYNADGTVAESTTLGGTGHTGINRLSADMDIYVSNGTIPTTLGNVTINENTPAGTNQTGGVTNVFLDQYFARASSMQIAPLKGKLSFLTATVQFNEDFRFIHNISVGTAATPANDFYISLSKLGDNLVRDVDGDDGTAANSDYDTDNKPLNANTWLKWQKLSAPTTWSAAGRGWWFSLPQVRVENFTTATKTLGLGDLDLFIKESNLDLKQLPVDNCYGSLTFC